MGSKKKRLTKINKIKKTVFVFSLSFFYKRETVLNFVAFNKNINRKRHIRLSLLASSKSSKNDFIFLGARERERVEYKKIQKKTTSEKKNQIKKEPFPPKKIFFLAARRCNPEKKKLSNVIPYPQNFVEMILNKKKPRFDWQYCAMI